MAVKHVLELTAKIALFIVTMLLVAKYIPYDGLVDGFLSKRVSFDGADKISKWILGEPDPEPYESIRDYIKTLINILISVPLFCMVITLLKRVSKKIKTTDLLKEWISSTLRRFAKLLTFLLLFWALLRCLPYRTVFPDKQTYSPFTMATIIGLNLLITIACYWFITNKITTKRSL
ncbi:hypothetical protein [Rouxiella sp. Mn2063]|uniref:hypothetical protein n=1 Tax=Rouxiella sp. Mn2063 TaxID=3395262 RepID=UPI003BE73A86